MYSHVAGSLINIYSKLSLVYALWGVESMEYAFIFDIESIDLLIITDNQYPTVPTKSLILVIWPSIENTD